MNSRTKKITCAAFMVLFLTFTATEAYSCSCREVTQREEFDRSGAVFIGKYVGVSESGGKVNFKVEKSWKGAEAGVVISLVYWELEGCDYDLNLVKRKKYLIYAVPTEKGLFISVDCGRSRAVKDARPDLKNMSKVVAGKNNARASLSRAAQQSLAADGAIACFSSNLVLRGLNADRAPQLKAIVMRHLFYASYLSSI